MSRAEGTLYQAGSSPVHRAHPITKLLYAVSMTAYSFVLSQPAALAALAACAFLVIVRAGVAGRFLRTSAGYLALLFFFLLIIQGVFYQGPSAIAFALGPASLKTAGLAFALAMILRIFTLVASFLAVILTTHPADLVQALEEAGASPRAGYLLLATLQLSPEMVERAHRIIDAQRSRGLRTDGSLVVRARGLFPLVAPLFYGSLMSIETKAMALTARAFFSPRKKTWLKALDRQSWEPGLRILLAAVFIVAVLARVAGWA